MVGIVGAQGQLTQSPNVPNPLTKYKRSKNVFAVTTVALIIGRNWLRLLQPLAQSLIGSPSTLVPGRVPGLGQIYFVNRVPKKLRGHPGGKIAQKSRNSCKLNGWGCGCIGNVDSGPKCAQS